MGRLIASFCCLIVGLQVLVGVPLAVCIGFLCLVESGSIGRISIEIHSGRELTSVSAPVVEQPLPPSILPLPPARTDYGAILESRALCGNPFAGTSLADSTAAAGDETDFMDTLRRIAAEPMTPAAPVSAEARQRPLPESGQADDSTSPAANLEAEPHRAN